MKPFSEDVRALCEKMMPGRVAGEAVSEDVRALYEKVMPGRVAGEAVF